MGVESEKEIRQKAFSGYQVNHELMKLAKAERDGPALSAGISRTGDQRGAL